jgi:hypothetical protein
LGPLDQVAHSIIMEFRKQQSVHTIHLLAIGRIDVGAVFARGDGRRIHGVLDNRSGRGPVGVRRPGVGAVHVHVMHLGQDVESANEQRGDQPYLLSAIPGENRNRILGPKRKVARHTLPWENGATTINAFGSGVATRGTMQNRDSLCRYLSSQHRTESNRQHGHDDRFLDVSFHLLSL